MELFIYAVYDYKVEEFQNIFTARHDIQAERMFTDVAKDPDTMIGRHPKDFAVVRLGRVDVNTGKLLTEEPMPRFLGTAYQYLTRGEEKEETGD